MVFTPVIASARSNPVPSVFKENTHQKEEAMEKQGYTYILFNKRNGTLYTGVTSNLVKRVYEHKNNLVQGFSAKHGTDKLGYYETCNSVTSAIEREKQIKSGSRKTKLALIESINPNWNDLYDSII